MEEETGGEAPSEPGRALSRSWPSVSSASSQYLRLKHGDLNPFARMPPACRGFQHRMTEDAVRRLGHQLGLVHLDSESDSESESDPLPPAPRRAGPGLQANEDAVMTPPSSPSPLHRWVLVKNSQWCRHRHSGRQQQQCQQNISGFPCLFERHLNQRAQVLLRQAKSLDPGITHPPGKRGARSSAAADAPGRLPSAKKSRRLPMTSIS